jgi:Fe-S-cluster containining protein
VSSGEIVRTSLLRTPFELSRESRFSYACHACKRCCRGKHIPVNPYEVARLAEHLGLSTTETLARYTEVGGAILKRRDDETCVFLGEGGCSVHSARPLACRLYPLGRQRTPDGVERFAELEPHPQTEGTYGGDPSGTVDSFLLGQGVAPYLAMADGYGQALARMMDALTRMESAVEAQGEAIALMAGPTATGDDNVLDVDATVARVCAAEGRPVPATVEERVRLHIEALERLAQQGP